MNLLENIREGIRSIISNRLRTILTSLIIAIGITSLVGILTAIDGLQSSVDNSFAGLGANTFDIQGPQMYRRFGGRSEKRVPPIDYHQAMTFKRRFQQGANIAVYASVTGAAQVKYASKKTNPNVQLIGVDDNYLEIKAIKLQSGRNFSQTDLENSLNVTIIGSEIATTLFERNINPLNKEINILGGKFKVIGVLEKKGGFSGGGDDRQALVPLENARAMAANRTLTFDITGSVPNMGDAEMAVAEARGLMRQIRRDPLGRPDSFEIKRADELAKDFENITGYLRIGGFGIGFITLLGASIALMNIMLVSVTERTREIGIRKSLGATPKRIREQFLIEAIVICIMGGLGGIVLGIGIGNLISTIVSQGNGQFVVPWFWMAIGILVCVTVGLFSGIYPAFKASRLDPIEALRYE
ncbi:ABC transporter permease [Larkinella terrae]|uniref:FtsX-like permease family protein n=1 Tax=Larkinella terrae TaxID=2025311 RepID=A0A7K0ELP1_9BACT|nr:ABC transporter permease [Larkinella terrae]MRS62747.1 FtsX-like permease family protein [Larkinella terrae]